MESVSGDLMRAIVVFLHASTEDYIRTNLRPITNLPSVAKRMSRKLASGIHSIQLR
ncbi:hypothetical protein ABIF97_006981 [Bradyrhizobium japonicum]